MRSRSIQRAFATFWIGLAASASLEGCREDVQPSGLAGPSQSAEPPAPGPTPPPGYTIEQIAYVSAPGLYDDPNGEIYLTYANGSGPKRLTFTAGYESELAWSPNGSRLAFVRDAGGITQIHTVSADGSQDVNLSNGPASDAYPIWSPDGQMILFQRYVTVGSRGFVFKDWEVYVMHADGSGQTNLSQYSLAYDGAARWSPDGSQIVFVSKRDGNSEVYRMNADGSGKLNLTQDVRPDSAPDWSPQGNKIAFIRRLRDGNALHVMNTDGSAQVYYPPPDVASFSAVAVRWSPTGGKILGWGDGLFTVNADGTGATPLWSDQAFEAGWSTDGKRVVWASGSGPCAGLHVILQNADGSGYQDLSPCDELTSRWPEWRPQP